MTLSEIPLTPSKPQRVAVTLSGSTFVMAIQWRQEAGTWIMDLFDNNENLLIAGVPLVPGSNLIEQYPELFFPGELWMQSDANPADLPTFDNLGVGSHLYYHTS